MTRILFVCLGNICRSPLAEGILRAQAGDRPDMEVDSAGTAAWHVGKAPDPRSIAIAARHGIDISSLRARQVCTEDFSRFDLILAMDAANLADLEALAPAGAPARLRRFLDRDVPDPYYGGADGFADVHEMLERGCAALLAELAGRR
ncbi:low molecular weight protein-tyrosine-phosphatase [Stappia sp.]|uniref:low molecular weight protein-tyrosine-phosphatase n=1 Tax=Stappia sp. TaxID=1870903 RepID=UPI003A9A1478